MSDNPSQPHNEAPATESSGQRVGYRNPPKYSQFRPGESGNPLGRPRGSLSFATELAAELSEIITVREKGCDARITKMRAIVKQLVAAAIEGDAKVASVLINLCAKLSQAPEADPGAAEDDAFVEELASYRRILVTSEVRRQWFELAI